MKKDGFNCMKDLRDGRFIANVGLMLLNSTCTASLRRVLAAAMLTTPPPAECRAVECHKSNWAI